MDKKISLLLVEDDENISMLLVDVLSAKNFDVTHFNDGKEALDNIKNSEKIHDLILLDEMLPSMNGSEILINIKADARTANIPIIMMTSIKDEEHQINVLHEGADDYINKPFRLNVLLARIETILRRAQSGPKFEISIPKGAKPDTITPKEIEILGLIAKGFNNSKIAQDLFISESTVANHLKSIYQKLNVESRTQAAIIALKLNIF